ncbi:MAG: 30S ribosomal protein S6 [Planctomycetota bacterium]
MSDQLRKYEGLFLFGSSASANNDEAMNVVRGYIEKHGGKIHVLKKWDDRRLAYEIKKQSRGVYFLSFFEAPPAAVDQINREVNLGDQVLRCLITDASHLTAAEVEAMQPQKPLPRKKTEDDDAPAPRAPKSDDAESSDDASDGDDDTPKDE